MMGNQITLQIRVDSDIKDQVSEIFEKMGIDIPTAVRMFFRATIRDKRLPFDTIVENTEKNQEKSHAEELLGYFKRFAVYEPPIISEEDNIVVLPLENGYEVPAAMYVQLVDKIPEGKVSCWEDITATLGHLYNKQLPAYPEKTLPKIHADDKKEIPFWRIVSDKGVLGGEKGPDRELKKEKLIKEGVPVVQRGTVEGSYKVENYKDYMFDFTTLKVIREV